MLFRIGGPVWKVLGLLVDEQLVSRNKALKVIEDLVQERMTEEELHEWMQRVFEYHERENQKIKEPAEPSSDGYPEGGNGEGNPST